MMLKVLPKNLTSYDLLKSLAVVLMVCDHVGYYFFPEQEWWRVFGRLCVPIWFFLIGYARNRELSLALLVGAGVLVLGNIVTGMSILPLNILPTILLVRLVLDRVAAFIFSNGERLVLGLVVILVSIIPSNLFSEYGTIGLLLALYGYAIRNGVTVPGFKASSFSVGFGVFVALSYVAIEQFLFAFSPLAFLVMAVGTVAVIAGLTRFRPVEYPALTGKVPGLLTQLFQGMGRHTLAIYVVHLLLLKMAALVIQPEHFVFMDWKFFSLTGF